MARALVSELVCRLLQWNSMNIPFSFISVLKIIGVIIVVIVVIIVIFLIKRSN